MKELKKWNGRGHGKLQNCSIYVAAYSQKQAAELVGKACKLDRSIGIHELKNYYSECWGDPMKGIEPTEQCVYAGSKYDKKPIKIL